MPDSREGEEGEEDPAYGTVLLSTFVIRRKRCRVYFHRGTLIWETERPPYTRWTLPLTNVLMASYADERTTSKTTKTSPNADATATDRSSSSSSVNSSSIGREKELEAAASSSSSSPLANAGGNVATIDAPPPSSFVLHYAAHGSKNKWRHHTVTMSHDDPRQVTSWVKTIRNYLRNLSHRPRKILLFVNPFGGKKKGLHILEKRVQPLLNIAGVEAKVVITERAGHIRDILMTSELDSYQAAVCIGGDGTFSELFNGLVAREARDQRVDLNDPDVLLPKPRLPVGVVPSGSTDTLAYSLHGTTDVETAAIHIIFGDTAGLDLSSVHNDRSLLRIYASILSYGYLGDVVRDSEKFRWMGPQRYDYSGFKKIIANKGYEGEVVLLSESSHPAACTRCLRDCSRCIERSHCGDSSNEISKWTTVRGKFFMVNGANISCACSKSPMGFSPHCHIGDGCVDVILVRHTSLINNIRMLLRLSSKDKSLYDLPFVEVYRAREFTFRASSPAQSSEKQQQQDNCDEKPPSGESRLQYGSSALSVWNCDGEVINAANVKIRVHCQLLTVFTRRMQPPSVSDNSSSCFCLL